MGACFPMGASLEPLATFSVLLLTTTCWATWSLCGATDCKQSQGHANKQQKYVKTYEHDVFVASHQVCFFKSSGLSAGAMRCVGLRTAKLRGGHASLHGTHLQLWAMQCMGLIHIRCRRSWWVAVAVWSAPWRGPQDTCNNLALASSPLSVWSPQSCATSLLQRRNMQIPAAVSEDQE